MTLAPTAGPVRPADYRVDTSAFREQKLASIAAHRTQLLDDDPRSFLLPGLIERLLDEERFHHASGPPLGEPFAGLFGAA